MTRPATVLLAAAAVGASACARSKPSTQAAPLPAPLVSALLGSTGAQDAQYTVDSLPESFPMQLRPPGRVTVVGGMTTGGRVTAVFADSSRPLAPVFERLFEQAGLRRRVERAPGGFSGGFTGGGGGPFCNDSSYAFVTPTADPKVVTVQYQRMRSMSCRDEPAVGPDLEIPALKPPPGVRVPQAGGGRGSDGVNARAAMTGVNLRAATILEHYATQLIAAGWKADAPAIAERVAAQFFEARSPAGQVWEGTMIVTGSETALSLTINMRPRTR